MSRRSFCWGGIFDIEALKTRAAELNRLSEDPKLWDNRAQAQKILQEKTRVDQTLENFHGLQKEFDDAVELAALADAEGDSVMLAEIESNLVRVAARTKEMQITRLFSGEADPNPCFLEIQSGAGGTESNDWASMLLRMYSRWAEKHGFTAELIDEQSGDQAGIKSATLKILGHNAYGWAKTESGVHRLVRISPFDSAGKRHTSFASVWVYPEIDDSIEIAIEEKDLRVDTFRASGAGGQHINKTDSAIRITHMPTGIVVQCQNNRSQHRNRAEAYKMLRARLYEVELQKKEAAILANNATKTDIGWGSQIRSYVLQPYQMVKDLRTDVETSNTSAVLDGDLDDFITAALALRVGNTRTN